MPTNDENFLGLDIPLNGRLITAEDPALIGANNFQTLQNLAYTDTGLQGISGFTKINSTAITTYTYLKNLFHFIRDTKLVKAADQSGVYRDSRLLAYGTDTSDANGRVFEIVATSTSNDIPNQKDFSSTAIMTNTDTTSNAGLVRFSDAPGNTVAMFNNQDTFIWTGAEGRLSGFICLDETDQSRIWDYTKVIQNTLSDSSNVATLQATTNGATSGTILLLHLDSLAASTFSDSSGNSNDFTANGNCAVNADTPFTSGNSCYFDGTGDYLSRADDADFDLSGVSNWSIDMQIKPLVSATLMYLYTQYLTATPAADYMSLYIDTNNKLQFRIATTAGGVIVSLSSIRTVTANSWNHIVCGKEQIAGVAVYFLYINGQLEAWATDTDNPANYNSSIIIGVDSSSANGYNGYIDEVRISNVQRYYGYSDYVVPSAPYASNMYVVMVASPLKLKGTKWYIATANTSAATVTGTYYKNGQWALLTVSGTPGVTDNTASGGVSLAVTNKSITFDDTTDADLHIFHDILGYWYKFVFLGCDATTTIYHCEGIANPQTITDIWDGEGRTVAQFSVYQSNTYYDYTTNVFEESWDSANAGTYVNLDALTTSTDHLIMAFVERVQAIKFYFAGARVNNTADTIARFYYWNGSAYTEVSYLSDGTASGNISFAKTGTMSFEPVAENAELKLNTAQGVPLYHYKLTFDKTLNGTDNSNLWLYYVVGIPASKPIRGHKFPLYWQNRLWLCSDQYENRNAMTCSSLNTYNVFNGKDSTTFYLGDNKELIAASSIYTRFSDEISESAVIFKKQGIFIITGNSPSDFKQYQLSKSIGCNAPLSLQSCDLGLVDGLSRNVLIWQSDEGVVLYDGQTIRSISRDIRDLYDPVHTNYIGAGNVHKSASFYDPIRKHYHLLLDKTTPAEWVYDIVRAKWFNVLRSTTGTKKYFCGCTVRDPNGLAYNYGGNHEGRVMRLENGQHNDSVAIQYILQTGDLNLMQSFNKEAVIRFVKLWHKSKNTTSSTITLDYYGDTNSTASTPAPSAQAISDSARRLKVNIWSLNNGSFVLHSFKFTLSTSDETYGFEPLVLSLLYKHTRLKLT